LLKPGPLLRGARRRSGPQRRFKEKEAVLERTTSFDIGGFRPDRNTGRDRYRCSVPGLADSRLKPCAGPEAKWRKGWDSNPRSPFELTAFPMLPVQPLLHLSAKIKLSKNHGCFGDVYIPGLVLPGKDWDSTKYVAERVGFEPTVPVRVQQFSRLPDSTTLAPLRERKILTA
jgi:hypothetical protein